MAKLILLPEEIRLIKGLVKHTKFNDQQITAIFSHLDRNINPREIGSIRKGAPKYINAPTAAADEVNALLVRYRRLQGLARRIGVNPSADNDLRVEKAVELMKSAVTIYNNSTISFRTEIFIVNAIIAWTYAVHAYFYKHAIKPVYMENGVPKLTLEGEEKLWDLSECLKSAKHPLGSGEVNNLKYLLLLRHEIEHRLARDIDVSVQPKVQACAINFSAFCEKHFGEEYSLKHDLDFTIQFTKLTMDSKNLLNAGASVPGAVKTVNKLIEAEMSDADYNDPAYAFRVYVVPKTVNNPKKADQGVTYAAAGSEIEMAIKLVERPKHRAGEVIKMVQALGHPSALTQTQDSQRA
ncbi:MAG: DUF3644 domain-containing protein [Rhodospirillaceae bacterium]|nr:DUF3644 domain-containing protein [Rhodospirillales bacterium]